MSKESFTELCSTLSPYISKKTTTLYDLMDEGRLRKVANAFGIAKSTVSNIVRRVSKTISLVLGPEYIKLPQRQLKSSLWCPIFIINMDFLKFSKLWMVHTLTLNNRNYID